MKDDKKLYKKSFIICLFAFLFIAFLTSFSYAFFTYSAEGVNNNSIQNCSIDMKFVEGDAISLVAAYPIDDKEAEQYDPYIVAITNDSSCNEIYYYLNMVNYCSVCSLDGDTCYLGNQGFNCSDDYTIDPQYIKYKITNLTTNESVIGTNPEYMYVEDKFLSNGTNKYAIILWISNKANSDDLYVYENDKPLEDANGKFITKNYLSRLDTHVTTIEENRNVAVFDSRYFDVSYDGGIFYSNNVTLDILKDNKTNILNRVWKENTQYEFGFDSYCAEEIGNLELNIIYTDGTEEKVISTACSDSGVTVGKGVSSLNKTIDSVYISYSAAFADDGALYINLENVLVKEIK